MSHGSSPVCVAEIRKGKEAALVDREEMELRYIKGTKEVQGQVSVLEQSMQAHVRRWKDVSEELVESQAHATQLHERIIGLERDKVPILQCNALSPFVWFYRSNMLRHMHLNTCFTLFRICVAASHMTGGLAPTSRRKMPRDGCVGRPPRQKN